MLYLQTVEIVFGGLASDDAEYFEKSFGTDTKQQRQFTYRYNRIAPINFLPNTYRTTKTEENRFRYTDIMELPTSRENADVVIKHVVNGELQKPIRITTYLRQYKKPEDIKKMEIKASDVYWENWLKKRETKKKEQKQSSLSTESLQRPTGPSGFSVILKNWFGKKTAKSTVTTEICEAPAYEFVETDATSTLLDNIPEPQAETIINRQEPQKKATATEQIQNTEKDTSTAALDKTKTNEESKKSKTEKTAPSKKEDSVWWG
jgi:hypothetical protein